MSDSTTAAPTVADAHGLYNDRHFGRIGEIVDYLPADVDESEEVKCELEELIKLTDSVGWQDALASVYVNQGALQRYVTEQSRGIILDILPLDQDSIVFELGPGLGQFTTQLAARCRAVYGLEVVRQQAAFALKRCRQEGLDNVYMAAGGHDCMLPYRDGSFDCAVLNLVFEWCGSRRPDRPVIESQRRLLSEAFRILKPGGSLYLNTKNRFALAVFLGRVSGDSMRLPFAHLLPYRLVELLDPLLRIRSGTPCRVHSHNALHRLITEAGFTDARSYWADPEMRYPTAIVPNEPQAIREARRSKKLVQGPSRKVRALMSLMPARLVKHFTPGLMFVAKRPTK